MALTISVTQDGSQVCALIGPDLMSGIAAFGNNVPDALQTLLYEIEQYDGTIEHIERSLERAGQERKPPRP